MPSTSFQIPEQYYIALFNALPGNSVLVKNDPPRFTILAATPAYLKQTGYTKADMMGKGVFEAFPVNSDPNYTGGSDLLASYLHASLKKEPHFLPVQRYDLKNNDGSFLEKHWRISNIPVFSPSGEVAYIIHTSEDITDQVKAELSKEKMKGMEQAHNLLMHIPLPVCILKGPALTLEMANEPSLQLWGKNKDIIGLPLAVAVPEIKGQGYIEMLHEVRESGIAKQGYESPVILSKNDKPELIYINFFYQPYYEKDKSEAVGVLAIGSDVTEQVLLRIRADESEDRFRTLADQAPMMVFLANPDGVVTYWNRFWLDYTGQSFEQALGRAWDEIVHPDDYQNLLQGYLAASKVQESYSIEARMKRWDGAYRYFLFTGGPRYSGNGTFLGNFGTGVDIHDRKLAASALLKSEANLRNLILKAPVGICIVSGDPVSVEITNDAFLDLTGKSREAFKQASYWEVLKEAATFYEPILQNVFTTGIAFHGQEHEMMLIRNGKEETVYVTFTYDPIMGEEGTIQKVMILALDVTEQTLARRKIEETVKLRTHELAQANDALVESNLDLCRSNANLEEFAYAASHDLKEPIRKIHFFADRLKGYLQGKLDEEANRYFERLETGAKRMATLIDDLLMYSHINRGASHLETVDLDYIIKLVEEDLELAIKDKSATITIGALPTIKGHKRQLQQLFENLVGNALKYSKPGISPQISISASVVKGNDTALHLKGEEGEKPFYLFEVADNGIGFDQKDADRIFNVFTRLHGNAEYKGTGVGLSIVRKVIENHHGYIWAESQLGVGATFRILLPVE